jgi:hypothetical protein
MSWPTSVSGTSVWTGRALQAENDDLEMIGLAHLYPFVFLAIVDIRARSISFVSRPEGHMCHLITNALARPFLHLLIPTRRPRRESQLWLSDQLEPSPRSHRRSLARSGERRGRQGAAAIRAIVSTTSIPDHLLHSKAGSATDLSIGGQFWALAHFWCSSAYSAPISLA